ncbi:MAG: diacylglycerol kinase family protein [Pseudomonadota bacterium]
MVQVSTSPADPEPQPAVSSLPTGPCDNESGRLVALINPLSFRMSLRDRAERSIKRVEAHGGTAFEASQLDDIEQALGTAYSSTGPISRLVIAGGDGTLQAVASWLARTLDPQQFPDLIVLSAGRTNYVAADVGTRKHFLDTLEQILNQPLEALHPELRQTLRLQHPDFGQQIGFFAAAGLVDYAIRDIHQWRAMRSSWWRNHHGATAAGLIRLGFRSLVGRSKYQAEKLLIDAGELGRLDGPNKLLLMTTLKLSGSAAQPYAQRGRGVLRMTAIRDDAVAFKRNLPNILRGRFKPDMDIKNGYLSGYCNSILIENINQITLYGQEFDLDPERPLQVEAGPAFRFLRP